MRDVVNPVYVLVIIGVMAWRCVVEGESDGRELDGWLLTLCVVGMVVNGVLVVARSLSHRPAIMKTVWAVGYLLLGSWCWVMRYTAMPTEEQDVYKTQVAAERDPLTPDAEGETLFSRAAALGKAEEVKRILTDASPTAEQIESAALRAAESNRVEVLKILAGAGVSPRAKIQGHTLLHAAAQNAACDAMKWLIQSGARVNERDDENSTPLIQATLSGKPAAVRLLLEKGADIELRDADGKSAYDYARTPELAELLSPNPPPQS